MLQSTIIEDSLYDRANIILDIIVLSVNMTKLLSDPWFAEQYFLLFKKYERRKNFIEIFENRSGLGFIDIAIMCIIRAKFQLF